VSRGPKSEIEKKGLGDEVVRLRLEGKTQEAIARAVGVDQVKVSKYLRKVGCTPENQHRNDVNRIKIELTREIAEMKFSERLSELEKNYRNAVNVGEMVEAAAWSKQWGDALVELFKLTGAYDRPPDTPTKIEVVIRRDDGTKT
jgi:predicted transcriptional regulator